MSSDRLRFVRGGCVFALVLAVGLSAGCSRDKRQTVHGTVTFKGEKLTAGTVRILGPGDQLATAEIRPDGTFAVTDVPPGEVRIAIVDTASGSSGAGPGAGAAAKRVRIPDKYKDVKTSGLVYTLAPDADKLEVKLD